MTALFHDGQTARPTALPSAQEVHVWLASGAVDEEAAHGVLAASEWRRAARFHFERDRERFLFARLTLRQLLAAYLEADPATLDFARGPHGKPGLAFDWSGLRFNLSHSEDLLLIACARGREVGADLEYMRDDVPFETLADAYFQPEDAWRLRLLPPHEKAQYFYEVWTRTEACLKADGIGLNGGTEIPTPERWSVAHLQPAEDYAAAVAAEGAELDVICHTWKP